MEGPFGQGSSGVGAGSGQHRAEPYREPAGADCGHDRLKVIAVIPARGGSKGLKRKNLRKICGKTLVDWAIDCAEASSSLSARIVVSSDDRDILRLAESRGCDAVLRPQALCADHASTITAVIHALIHLANCGDLPDAICLLQPTNPLRLPKDVDAAVAIMQHYGCGSVITHSPARSHPARQIWGDTLEPLMDTYTANRPRQELRPVFDRDGSVYLTRVDVLRKGTFYSSDGRILIIPPRRHLDIETKHDMKVAEYLMWRRIIARQARKRQP